MGNNIFDRILVTGGAGYVGSNLIPKLLDDGYEVVVLDLFIYGDDIFGDHSDHANLTNIKGDMRDASTIASAVAGCGAVIHLACISNDPSFDLNPDLGKSINFDCFRPMVQAAKTAGVRRFVYASSSSVYGIKDEPEVTEDLTLEPLTDYSKFKAMCEDVLHEEREPGFVTCIIRPATVCGYAPRQRLDVVVNILTNLAVNTGKIKVFGGSQKRPNIHIDDMADVYRHVVRAADEVVDGKTWNAGYENHTVMQLAEMVKGAVGEGLEVEVLPTDDNRSYQVSSGKISAELGFRPSHTIEEAVNGLVEAFADGRLPDSLTDPRYFNIKMMQGIDLK